MVDGPFSTVSWLKMVILLLNSVHLTKLEPRMTNVQTTATVLKLQKSIKATMLEDTTFYLQRKLFKKKCLCMGQLLLNSNVTTISKCTRVV